MEKRRLVEQLTKNLNDIGIDANNHFEKIELATGFVLYNPVIVQDYMNDNKVYIELFVTKDGYSALFYNAKGDVIKSIVAQKTRRLMLMNITFYLGRMGF